MAQMVCEVLILLNDGVAKRRIYINFRFTGGLFAKMRSLEVDDLIDVKETPLGTRNIKAVGFLNELHLLNIFPEKLSPKRDTWGRLSPLNFEGPF